MGRLCSHPIQWLDGVDSSESRHSSDHHWANSVTDSTASFASHGPWYKPPHAMHFDGDTDSAVAESTPATVPSSPTVTSREWAHIDQKFLAEAPSAELCNGYCARIIYGGPRYPRCSRRCSKVCVLQMGHDIAELLPTACRCRRCSNGEESDGEDSWRVAAPFEGTSRPHFAAKATPPSRPQEWLGQAQITTKAPPQNRPCFGWPSRAPIPTKAPPPSRWPSLPHSMGPLEWF